MGRHVSWKQRECGQTQERQDPEGESLAAHRPRRGGQRGRPNPQHIPLGSISQTRRPPRTKEGYRGRRPQHPDHHLPHAPTRNILPGPWSSLLRPTQPPCDGTPSYPRSRAPRLQGHPTARRLTEAIFRALSGIVRLVSSARPGYGHNVAIQDDRSHVVSLSSDQQTCGVNDALVVDGTPRRELNPHPCHAKAVPFLWTTGVQGSILTDVALLY